MRRIILFPLIVLVFTSAAAATTVKTVDFLAGLKLAVNGAGPLLVRYDPPRQRIVLVNTLTSSLTLITGPERQLTNVPLASRIPQYLKSEALAINSLTGDVYLIGNRCLQVVFAEHAAARAFDTGVQYEMAAVEEKSGDAFLVGRESGDLAIVRIHSGTVRTVPWADRKEKLINLNMTPPPAIRKVAIDSDLNRVLAIDGYTSTLAVFDSRQGKLLSSRKLNLVSGARWHWGGYDQPRRRLVVAVETDQRQVVSAASIDWREGNDRIVALPGLTEGVGIRYSPKRQELAIAYDNHPTVHLVCFATGSISEVKVPAYGNDAAVIDEAGNMLYVASWAYGEIDQIDLNSRKLKKRILNIGVIPHMFGMEFDSATGKLVIPLGASAVNGSFGAAVTLLDPASEKTDKRYCGWAPVDLIERPGSDGFLVFNSEDQMAVVEPDGRFQTIRLPVLYPHRAVADATGHVFLAYGPHQSYWPVVYIWGARNGILGITDHDLSFYDRRIPRLAQGLVVDGMGALYGLQNNWGEEKQFLITLGDEVRAPNLGDMRIELPDTVLRETSQRILAYDPHGRRLLIARVGETDADRGILQVFNPETRVVEKRLEVGLTPTDIAFDEHSIMVSNFDSHTVTRIRRLDYATSEIPCGKFPLKIVKAGSSFWVLDHGSKTLTELGTKTRSYKIPTPGNPDNLFVFNGRLIITSHGPSALDILEFDPSGHRFRPILHRSYPYGETTFASANSSFYLRGQFGDCLYELSRLRVDRRNRLWITDFLSGKLFIISGLVNS